MRFLFLAAIGHQVTYGVVEGDDFDDVRRRLSRLDSRVDAFVHCPPCVAVWVGFILASIYRPNLLADLGGRRPSAARQVANLAADAVLIALGTSWWHEGLHLMQRVIERERPQTEVEPADRVEIERPTLPGISIRSQGSVLRRID